MIWYQHVSSIVVTSPFTGNLKDNTTISREPEVIMYVTLEMMGFITLPQEHVSYQNLFHYETHCSTLFKLLPEKTFEQWLAKLLLIVFFFFLN